MNKPLRIGVIGTSFVSDWFCEAAGLSESCAVSAIYSREGGRGAAFAEKHGIKRSFSDESAFLSDESIDAVYIASPNIAHYRQTMAALEHGKHVLCEKPLALNAAQAECMIEKAHEEKLIVLEAIRPVHDPFLQALRDSLPLIGRIRRASFEFCQYSSRYERFLAGERPNVFESSLGNAALMDLAVYCLHICAALFGMPEKLTAGASFLPNGTEAAGTLLLDYGEQQTTISYSKVTDSVCPSLIQGEKGSVGFDKPNQPTFLRFYPLGGEPRDLPFTQAKNNMVFELEAFARLIETDGPADAFDEQSLMVARLLDEARRQTGIDFGDGEAV
jgi:predicted dehydrogenase